MPTFTPFLPRRQFLPHQAFYPNFTPFLVLSGLQFPRFYPKGKTAHFLLVLRKAATAFCNLQCSSILADGGSQGRDNSVQEEEVDWHEEDDPGVV